MDTILLESDIREFNSLEAMESIVDKIAQAISDHVEAGAGPLLNLKLVLILSSSGIRMFPYRRRLEKWMWKSKMAVIIADILAVHHNILKKVELDISFDDETRPNISEVVYVLQQQGVVMENLEEFHLVGEWGMLVPGIIEHVMPKLK